MNVSMGHSGKRTYLAAEVISMILSYHTKQYIKADRLVCKVFCTWATPYLIDTAFVGSQKETLDRFEEIANHNIFSKTVKTMVFTTCSFEEKYETVKDYHGSLVYSHWRWATKVPPPPLKQCEQHWQDYQRLSKEQADLQQKGEDKIRIRKALCSMPNIKHLAISTYKWTASHPLHKIWLPDEYSCLPSQPSHGFNTMTSALLYNGVELSSIMQAEPDKLGGCLQKVLEKTQEIFRPIKKLALTMENVTALKRIENHLLFGTKLEHLEIDLRIWSSISIKDSKMFHVTWPSLRHLKLGLVNIDYKSFLRFCKNHWKTLQSLELDRVHLSGGGWENLMKEMKEHLRLTNVRLENLEEDGDGLSFIWTTIGPAAHRLLEAELYLQDCGENPFDNSVLVLSD